MNTIRFYGGEFEITDELNIKTLKEANPRCRLVRPIEQMIRNFIRDVGAYTANRITQHNISPFMCKQFGAGELSYIRMLNGLNTHCICVFDGAGTVITNNPEIACASGLAPFVLKTDTKIVDILSDQSCIIPFPGEIKQYEAYKKYKSELINPIVFLSSEDIENIGNIHNATIFVVCTRYLTNDRQIKDVKKYADVVWSCNSHLTKSLSASNEFNRYMWRFERC